MSQTVLDKITNEKAELASNISKLGVFLESDSFKKKSDRERYGLLTQYSGMKRYLQGLEVRIQCMQGVSVES